MINTVAILGMGWLGQNLAAQLDKSYRIKGSVMTLERATELQQRGYDAYRIIVSDNGVEGRMNAVLDDVDCVIITIPPGFRRLTGVDYFKKMQHLYDQFERYNIAKVIFISCISVYDDSQGRVTEDDIPTPSTSASKQIKEAEDLFLNSNLFKTTIIRFGGMFGGSRQPLRYLTGRKDLNDGAAPVNLIHRTDCVGIIKAVLDQDAFSHVFNGVYPEHPSREIYYTQRAARMELDPPIYKPGSNPQDYKQVDSKNLTEILNYQFVVSI